MNCDPLPVLRPFVITIGLAAFSLGCASGLPAVISSTSEQVAVEFEKDSSLKEPGQLASKECGKFGKAAEFDKVDMTATPKSRIARYKCVSNTGMGREEAPAENE